MVHRCWNLRDKWSATRCQVIHHSRIWLWHEWLRISWVRSSCTMLLCQLKWLWIELVSITFHLLLVVIHILSRRHSRLELVHSMWLIAMHRILIIWETWRILIEVLHHLWALVNHTLSYELSLVILVQLWISCLQVWNLILLKWSLKVRHFTLVVLLE